MGEKLFAVDSNIRMQYFVKNKCGYDNEVVCRMSVFRLSPACSTELTFFYLSPVGGRSQQIFRGKKAFLLSNVMVLLVSAGKNYLNRGNYTYQYF